jgi:hypothetical protein
LKEAFDFRMRTESIGPILKKAYLRKLPRKPFGPGCSPWSGDWCTYPSVLFMFGQMDNRVWPYPTADR